MYPNRRKAAEIARDTVQILGDGRSINRAGATVPINHLDEFDNAIECFRTAIKLELKNPHAGRNLCVAQGKNGWHLINSPDPKQRDPKRALEAVQEAVGLNSQSERPWQYLGLVQYRIGNCRASIEALEKSCKLHMGSTGDAGKWIVLALAHARLAAEVDLHDKERELHRAEARRWFDQADKQIDGWWRVRPADVTGQAIWDFRAEAREMIGPNDGKK
jgi:tetratricopeptide (TPR) repeat protein